jgi:hypothetical protein
MLKAARLTPYMTVMYPKLCIVVQMSVLFFSVSKFSLHSLGSVWMRIEYEVSSLKFLPLDRPEMFHPAKSRCREKSLRNLVLKGKPPKTHAL